MCPRVLNFLFDVVFRVFCCSSRRDPYPPPPRRQLLNSRFTVCRFSFFFFLRYFVLQDATPFPPVDSLHSQGNSFLCSNPICKAINRDLSEGVEATAAAQVCVCVLHLIQDLLLWRQFCRSIGYQLLQIGWLRDGCFWECPVF